MALPVVLCIFVQASPLSAADAPRAFQSHPPTRPLPTASARPLGAGPAYFADAKAGHDDADGSQARPWKTLAYAIGRLKPGDTLYLRGGVYYERVTISAVGTPEKPITIRSYPKELAIIDGGIREFFENADKVWEPCPGGAEGEYRSTRAYPDLGAGVNGFNTHAYFGDSMVPMQGYRYIKDLRDPSMVWDVKNKTTDEEGVYCGPGVYYDVKTGRFHVRLAHTTLKALGDDNYRGVTDPRKIPLVVAAWKNGPTLTVLNARDVHFQDLVVRGSSTATVDVSDSARLVFDGLTVYSGQTGFRVRDTFGLRVLHTACRGIAAPWTFRGHLKYRSSEARIFSGGGWSPTGRDSRDFELAYCEFTDSVDGVFLGNVRGVHFHHNLLDNISDDGLFLTAATGYDGVTPGGDVFVYQNLLSRCLTTFAFGVGHGRQKTLATGRQTGSGVHVYRNVFDFRRPVMYQFPASPDGAEELPSKGRFANDHGSPAWEPMNIYHNTVVSDGSTGYDYGTHGFTGGLPGGNKRRVFNNLVVQLGKFPSTALVKPSPDLEIDGNLFWSAAHGSAEDFLSVFRKKNSAPGLGVHDRFADPRFAKFSADWKAPIDLRLEKGSAAIDAGVELPSDWPDPGRKQDSGKPDAGALPVGGEVWRVGVRGRLMMFGGDEPTKEPPAFTPSKFADVLAAYRTDVKPAAIVQGYPELDSPIIEYVLKRRGVPVDVRERSWLDVADYSKYSLVVIAGDLQRAGTKPDRYSEEDVGKVRKYLTDGGTIWLLRRGKRVFDWSPQGQKFLQEVTGRKSEKETDPKMAFTRPIHPWVKHLDQEGAYPWLAWRRDNDNAPLRVGKDEQIIASPGGTCLLYRVQVGKGQLIYIGWQVADSMPNGRLPSTVGQEKSFEEQVKVLSNIVEAVYPPK
jgi:hypothetical protein